MADKCILGDGCEILLIDSSMKISFNLCIRDGI
ncbi:hypothetical protein F383_38722 [Gossypium arboreum]|uniref:Uncharacterized protein n=1 Tax=Gossypium arboreum TaxID=29729 RepID=A0A0B0MGT0_GOSAR|nr:hypothetical protein F383_38722 [Gossypium arboreum]